MHALLSDDNNFVHGAMRVLTEFSSEVTPTQIPQVAPIILPQMCLILTEDTVQCTLQYTVLLYINDIVQNSVNVVMLLHKKHHFYEIMVKQD